MIFSKPNPRSQINQNLLLGNALNSILEKIVTHKLSEIASAQAARPLKDVAATADSTSEPRDFLAALQNAAGIALIAEVKKASPSKGIIRVDFDPVTIAQTYAGAGASCISVLTDEIFFQGHLDYLTSISQQVNLPLLRKDFIIDEYQVFEARAAGADAVLLIAECLEPDQLIGLHKRIRALGMTPLVELYDAQNIDKVMAADPVLVGVNNRDLNTFEVDLNHSVRLKQQLPTSVTFVSESGIYNRSDVEMLEKSGVDAMLVGESLMRANDIAGAVKTLLGN